MNKIIRNAESKELELSNIIENAKNKELEINQIAEAVKESSNTNAQKLFAESMV